MRMEDRYKGSGAPEVFLSFETPDDAQTLCGFLRLRLPHCSVVTPADCDGTNDSCIYTPLRRSTECSTPLKPGTLRYNPPSAKDGDSISRNADVSTPIPAAAVGEGAIAAQQSVRAKERKAAATAAANGNEVVCAFPELQGCALIRELHVYGKLVVADTTAIGPTDSETDASEDHEQEPPSALGDTSSAPQQRGVGVDDDKSEHGGSTGTSSTQSQHGGFGRRLMARAEEIAIEAVRRTLRRCIHAMQPEPHSHAVVFHHQSACTFCFPTRALDHGCYVCTCLLLCSRRAGD